MDTFNSNIFVFTYSFQSEINVALSLSIILIYKNVMNLPDVQIGVLPIHFLHKVGEFCGRIKAEEQNVSKVFDFGKSFDVMLDDGDSGDLRSRKLKRITIC